MMNGPQSEEPGEAGVLLIERGERFQLAQALYNAVTAKTEKLIQGFSVDCIIRSTDFDQLEAKCAQACTQWEVLKSSTSVTVHHTDDNSEQFSSYERFRVYDKSRTAPVESVVYERDMLLRMPSGGKPQPYKVVVRSLSRVAMMRRMDREMGGPPPSFIRFFTSGPIVVEITYVDYVVARNILSTIDSWVREVERAPMWSWATRLHPFTLWIRRLIVAALTLVMIATALIITPEVLGKNADPAELARWLILAGSGIWLAAMIAQVFGRMFESAIDNIVPLSCILLNKGDERLKEEFEGKNWLRAARALVGVLLGSAQGVLTKTVSLLLVRLLVH